MISSKDALLLRRIVSGEIKSRMDRQLNSEERERIGQFHESGYIYLSLDGLFDVLPSAQDALDEYDQAVSKAQQQAREHAQQIAADQAEKQRVLLKERADKRREYILFVLGLLLGWVLGCFTPIQAWEWIQSLIH